MTPTEAVRNPDLDRRALGTELGVVLIVVWLPLVVAGSVGRGEPRAQTIASELYGIATEVGVIGLLLYLLWRNREPWRHVGLRRVRWWSELLWAGVIYVACWVAWMLLTRWAALLYGPAPETTSPEKPGAAYLVALPLFLVISAAFEELFVRGYLWNRLQRLSGSKAVALVGSSLLFAAYHPYRVYELLYIFTFGLVLGLFQWKGRSLPRLILAHTLFNLSVSYP
jgi:membrane protease YdiL (CAAX protease family)